jgi:hypothetical protein
MLLLVINALGLVWGLFVLWLLLTVPLMDWNFQHQLTAIFSKQQITTLYLILRNNNLAVIERKNRECPRYSQGFLIQIFSCFENSLELTSFLISNNHQIRVPNEQIAALRSLKRRDYCFRHCEETRWNQDWRSNLLNSCS